MLMLLSPATNGCSTCVQSVGAQSYTGTMMPPLAQHWPRPSVSELRTVVFRGQDAAILCQYASALITFQKLLFPSESRINFQ